MSNSEVLYMKGMEVSESEDDDGNPWDDRKLNDAYDKAVNAANAEIAKRVAMSTNTQKKKENKQSSNKKQPLPKQKQKKWKVGMPCRALYEEDGLEYEAFIVSIVNEKDCIVQFVGYNNLQMVSMDSLEQLSSHEYKQKPTQTEVEREDDGFESQSQNNDDAEDFVPEFAQLDSIKELYQKNNSGKKKSKKKSANSFTLPDIPMPDMSMINNLGALAMPLPPPPPNLEPIHGKQELLSSMLLSWYMSGYYTGLYQGMKSARNQTTKEK